MERAEEWVRSLMEECEKEARFRNVVDPTPHLSYDRIIGLVDRTMKPKEVIDAMEHAMVCKMCGQNLGVLLSTRVMRVIIKKDGSFTASSGCHVKGQYITYCHFGKKVKIKISEMDGEQYELNISWNGVTVFEKGKGKDSNPETVNVSKAVRGAHSFRFSQGERLTAVLHGSNPLHILIEIAR